MTKTTEKKMSFEALAIWYAADTYREWYKEAEIEAKSEAFKDWNYLINGELTREEFAEIFETFEKVATSAVSPERRAFAKTYLATMATLSNI